MESFISKGLFLAAVLAWAIAASVQASLAQAAHNKFDSYVQAYVRNGDFSGSVLVTKAGHTLFRKSYGFANTEWGIPNSENTKFHIASVTKTFTAAGILILEQQDKLKLSDPLSKYVPDYLNGDRITIETIDGQDR